jgi:hypothetical protein
VDEAVVKEKITKHFKNLFECEFKSDLSDSLF